MRSARGIPFNVAHAAGNFALAYVVAHEWAHHLQHVLLDVIDNDPAQELKSIQIELQADCLAGVWAYSTWARELLEPGDIEKAIKLAELLGDRPGTSANDPSAHGSAAPRVSWFNRGYLTGKGKNCIVPAP